MTTARWLQKICTMLRFTEYNTMLRLISGSFGFTTFEFILSQREKILESKIAFMIFHLFHLWIFRKVFNLNYERYNIMESILIKQGVSEEHVLALDVSLFPL